MTSPPFSHQGTAFPAVHRVLSTADVLGTSTIDVVSARKRFAEDNPAVIGAFLAAMEEADRLISTDRAAAVRSYLKVSSAGSKPELIEAMLADPETTFTVAPRNFMQYVEFLGQTGQVKDPPVTWEAMFVPQMAGRTGN